MDARSRGGGGWQGRLGKYGGRVGFQEDFGGKGGSGGLSKPTLRLLTCDNMLLGLQHFTLKSQNNYELRIAAAFRTLEEKKRVHNE